MLPILNTLEDVELMSELLNGKKQFLDLVETIDATKFSYAYGKDKWTVAEVLLHIIDTERVFQYRALCFCRNDKTALPSFNENDYVKEVSVANRNKENIVEEFLAVRESTITLFKNITKEQLLHTGTASNIQWSVGGLGFVICGHQKHHMKILKERYF
ncbi:DinB family protein [uncultured Maribacter sp.]|uniref:DinB family protein n=1 Tax=uncultured Maribacter sp. TaxID=431308 RepID=UPI0026074CF7|nr:DinB family protein [uncultured Maribacter sp.]